MEKGLDSQAVRERLAKTFINVDPADTELRSVIAEAENYPRRGIVDGTPTYTVGQNSIFLAVLEIGSRGDANSCAFLLHKHVLQKLAPELVTEALQEHPFQFGFDAASQWPPVAPSMWLIDREASRYAVETSDRSTYGMHHLLAALVHLLDSFVNDLPDFGVTQELVKLSLLDFRPVLFKWIEDHRNQENLNVWAEILAIERRNASIPPNLISGFSTDRPGIDAGDSLGIGPDVQAFARLICLKDARPPLSIGLFGGWGAGKSTFMEQLETAINTIIQAEAKRRENVKAGTAEPQRPDAPGFLARVAHIRFNAWQYSDANLWASLTTEFFDQLRAGGHGRQGRALHDKLVERVKAHVNTLAGSADATRKALADSEDALVAAEKARDDAAAKVTTIKDEVLEKSLGNDLAASFDRNKNRLVEVGLTPKGADLGTAIRDFADLVSKTRTLPGKLGILRDAIWNGKYRWVVGIALLAIIVAGLAVILLPEWTARLHGWFFSASVLAIIAAFFRPALVVVRLILDTAGIADKLKEADAAARKDLAARESDVRVRAEDVEARRATVARAETALARYAGPPGTPSSPRVLHFLLNDDPETKQIEGQIGLISRARRLFQAVDEIAAEERLKGDPDEDVPERIVLYIDDLDRCSHDQVYAVLQAVHLLLEFELFVVVVGVDVAWVEEAITRQLRDGPQTQGDDEIKRRKRAIDYLQKIFQIPFWLKPLSTVGDDGGSYGRFVTTLVGADAESVPPDTERRQSTREEPANTEIQVHLEQPQEGEGTPSSFVVVPDEPLEPERLLETVRLDPREVEFLKSPEIGAIAAHDPRGVKRMINTYRLARARMSREELDKLLDADNPMYPILALFTAIETGQTVEIADAVYSSLLVPRENPLGLIDLLTVKEDEQKEELKKVVLEGKSSEEEVIRRRSWHAIVDAGGYAMRFRQYVDIPSSDCLPIARLVRRYSFSRKQ